MVLRGRLLSVLLVACSVSFAQTDEAEAFGRYQRSGDSFLFNFKPDSALLRYRSALAVAIRSKNDFRIGISLLGAGQSQWYMGRNEHAIDTIKRAISYLRKLKFTKEEYWFHYSALRVLSNIYDGVGDYEKAFEATSEALLYYKKGGDKQNAILTLVQMANLYRNIGEYHTAFSYYREAERLKPKPREYEYRELYHQLGRLYAERHLFDSALTCYRKALPGHPNPRVINVRIGESYLLQGKYDEAWQYLSRIYKQSPVIEESQILVPAMIGMGKIYLHRGHVDSALGIALDAVSYATLKNARHNKRDASLLVSEIYSQKNDSGRALHYYRQYVSLKDSVVSEQFKGQLYSFRQNAEESEHATQVKLLRWSIFGLIALGGLVIFILLLRTNHQKLKMRQRAGELEMQALRAQMNPHFIFNCLSAINHFILNNDADKASRYLTRFSRLIRLVLVNSGKTTISLAEELDMLRIYLDMEQLRFKDAFEYRISYAASVNPSLITVPSFILQPFCENAIWHGLLHKKGKGILTIDFRTEKNAVVCVITDNGVGREKAARLEKKTGEKTGSFGHKLTTERIALFNRDNRLADSFEIEDVKDQNGDIAGTRVVMRIKTNSTHD